MFKDLFFLVVNLKIVQRKVKNTQYTCKNVDLLTFQILILTLCDRELVNLARDTLVRKQQKCVQIQIHESHAGRERQLQLVQTAQVVDDTILKMRPFVDVIGTGKH